MAQINLIKKVHWNCYGNCNMPCDFCYAWFDKKPTLNTTQSIELLKRVKETLGENITFAFSGGDPLLRKDLLQLIRFAKTELNFKIELQTNAIKLDSTKLNNLIEYVDKFGFSLDGEDQETHYEMRGVKDNFNHIFEILGDLDRYRNKDYKFDVTVRTIISNKNKNNIKRLGEALLKFNCVTKWSLRQFVPLEEGFKTKVIHDIDTEEFNEIVTSIVEYTRKSFKTNYLNRNLKITKVDTEDMENCYCLIAPNGDIYYHPDEGENYFSVGNILTDGISLPLETIKDKCKLREQRDKRNSLLENTQ